MLDGAILERGVQSPGQLDTVPCGDRALRDGVFGEVVRFGPCIEEKRRIGGYDASVVIASNEPSFFEPTDDLAGVPFAEPRRFCYIALFPNTIENTPTGSRTQTQRILSPLPLPSWAMGVQEGTRGV